MKVLNKYIILILGFFLISLTSANGLNVVNDSYQVNKTYGEDTFINLTIINQESFTFSNISSDKLLIFDKFTLESGKNKTIIAKINSNDDFNGQVRIRGDYYTVLGTSNKTEMVTLDMLGLDLCDFNLIIGDSITWKNTLSGEIKLRNLNSGEYFETIGGNSQKTIKFDSPTEFDYQIFKVGLPFSQVCHLNIMPTEGYIHNADYDKIVNLNLKIRFPNTTISSLFLTENFTVNYNTQKDDIFKVINTGTKVAKNIKISGEWLIFGNNNFDLNIEQSVNIPYTIRPIIFQTNQTNKTYQIPITIEGNFPTFTKNISVFIPYQQISVIGDNNLTMDKESLRNTVNLICSIFPEICPTRVVYGNESERNVTFTINEQTYKEKILADDKFQEEMREQTKLQDEKIQGIIQNTNETSDDFNQTLSEIRNSKETTDNLISIISFGGIIFLGLIAISILTYLIFNQTARERMFSGLNMHKGEKQW
jgi:hypothetical protein